MMFWLEFQPVRRNFEKSWRRYGDLRQKPLAQNRAGSEYFELQLVEPHSLHQGLERQTTKDQQPLVANLGHCDSCA